MSLREEVRRYEANKLPGRNDLGLLPKPWKVPHISSHEIIRTGCIGTFDKYVVTGVLRDLKTPRWNHKMGSFSEELEQLLTGALADMEFRTRQHIPIFRENSR